MEIKFDTICRNANKIYASFKSSEKLTAVTTVGDFTLPVLLIENPTCASEQLLCMPEFNEQKLTISNGTETFEKEFKMSSTKWESRLNYKLKKEESFHVRDFDRWVERRTEEIDIWEIIPAGELDVLHGLLSIDQDITEDVELICIGDAGQIVSQRFYNMGDINQTTREGKPIRQISFSLRVAKNAAVRVFCIRKTNTGELVATRTMSDHEYHDRRGWFEYLYTTAQYDSAYNDWFLWRHRATLPELAAQKEFKFETQPLFSIIIPVYKPEQPAFDATVKSVLDQTYGNFELIIANATPEETKVNFDDARIVEIETTNEGISANTAKGTAHAKGDFVAFLDHDDLLEPNALFEYARAINEHPAFDVIYCDEDKVDASGRFLEPNFKPDFSIDLLRANNYICHMTCVRKSLYDAIEKCGSELDGAQDYDLLLKLAEAKATFGHVAKVLYHWRMSKNSTATQTSNKQEAVDLGVLAVQNHLERLGIQAKVEESCPPTTKRIHYTAVGEPKVSIIIPNKDCEQLLETCVNSILEKSTYQNYEILIVENNSTNEATFELYKKLEAKDARIKVLTWSDKFNYSKINNFAATHATGDYFLFLNNDTEVIAPGWIEELIGVCMRPEVGACGAKLWYCDDTIQHAGVLMPPYGPDHANGRLPKGVGGYYGREDAIQNFNCVTAACLMSSKEAFESIDGFNEELAVAYNDVDYCLRLREAGYINVYQPNVELYHYESASRGFENTPEKEIRFMRETGWMRLNWPKFFVQGDEYLNPNLHQGNPQAIHYKLS